MPRFLPALCALAAAIVLGLGVWGCFGITRHVIAAVDKWGDAAPATVANEISLTATAAALTKTADAATVTLRTAATTIAAVQPVIGDLGVTVDKLNRNCDPIVKGLKLTVDSEKPCGTLADIDQTLRTVRGTFGQIEIAANHEDRNLATLDGQELALFNDFHGLASKGTETVTDINTLLESQAVKAIPVNLAALTGHGNGILGDFQKVADKETNDLLSPKPWWMKLTGRAGDAIDIAAAVARNIP